MTRPLATVVLLWALSPPLAAWAQQQITVQLPTFNVTTVSTSVSVPDRGTGLLGGIGRASEGSVSRGLPMLSKVPGLNRLSQNRGIGREVGSMSMTVSPRVIILEEEELRQTGFSADMLSLGTGGRSSSGLATPGATDPAVARQAAFLARNIGRRDADFETQRAGDGRAESLAEVRRQNEAALAARASEAKGFFDSGRRAESEGKTAVARIHYQMALRRAEGPLQQAILARLSELDGAAQPPLRLAER